MQVKTKVVSFEETSPQSSPAAPDGNQMEENDRKGGSLRIYPLSSGETPSSDHQYEKKGDARLLLHQHWADYSEHQDMVLG